MTREELPSISLMYVTGERNHLIAQAVQEQWRKALDVNVELQAVERKCFLTVFQRKISSWLLEIGQRITMMG